jgi:ABC-type transport system substrate-binding protein
MRKVKWIFFGYLAFVAAVVLGIGVSFSIAPPRDPETLHRVFLANIKSLDPAVANDEIGLEILPNIYEALYDYKYGVKPDTLYPRLAAEMPRVSDGGRTLIIKLRKGIHYYDPWKEAFKDGVGPEVKAADVIYAWKRVADFQVASPNYTTIFQEGLIPGLDEWNAYTEKAAQKEEKIDYDRPVEGLDALDDYTLRVKLSRPSPQFRLLMAYPGTAPVCRAAVEHYGERFKHRPVGTGPYYLESALPEQRIVLAANPIYRGRPDIDGTVKLQESERLPRIKRVQLDYFQEPIPVWHLFRKGLYDIAGIPKETFGDAVDVKTQELTPQMKAQGVKLIKTPEPMLFYYGFNMKDPVMGKNKPLRQAMSMAYDREKYIRVYWNGRGVPARQPIPPGFPAYDTKLDSAYAQYNLDAAKRKMKEAEAINGGPFEPIKLLLSDTGTIARDQGEFFVSEMRKIGLTIQPEYNTWARYLEIVDNREMPPIFAAGWGADYPDERTFLQIFYSKFAPRGGLNSTQYINPDFDKLYDEAAVMDASPERAALYKKMCAMVNEDCVWIYDYYRTTYRLHYDWLSGVEVMDFGSSIRNEFLTLDVKKRQAFFAKR